MTIQLVSDSAAACIKVGKIYLSQSNFTQQGKGTFAIHSLCLMHATHSSVSAALKLLSLHAPVFCGSVLLHQGRTFDNVRKMVKEQVGKSLILSYEWCPSFEKAEAYLGLGPEGLTHTATLIGPYPTTSPAWVGVPPECSFQQPHLRGARAAAPAWEDGRPTSG